MLKVSMMPKEKIDVNIAEIFHHQFQNDIFSRFDVVVKYLAVENHFGINDTGFALYEKALMQRRRYWKHRGYIGRSKNKKYSSARFKNLVRSVEVNGYNTRIPLKIDAKYLQLRNGSHRFACAIFFDIESVPILKIKGRPLVNFGLQWFNDYGFTDHEMGIMQKTLNRISEKYKRIC